jgi:hypothetical protein
MGVNGSKKNNEVDMDLLVQGGKSGMNLRELAKFGGRFGNKSAQICRKEENLRLTMSVGLATVGRNVNQCSTSSTGSRRRSSRRQRGLLSNVRMISTKTHGWQRSWVFLCNLRSPVKMHKTADNC